MQRRRLNRTEKPISCRILGTASGRSFNQRGVSILAGALKEPLAARELLVGTFIKTPSPIVVEVLGMSGLDFLCLDAGNAPFDRTLINHCMMAARADRVSWFAFA